MLGPTFVSNQSAMCSSECFSMSLALLALVTSCGSGSRSGGVQRWIAHVVGLPPSRIASSTDRCPPRAAPQTLHSKSATHRIADSAVGAHITDPGELHGASPRMARFPRLTNALGLYGHTDPDAVRGAVLLLPVRSVTSNGDRASARRAERGSVSRRSKVAEVCGANVDLHLADPERVGVSIIPVGSGRARWRRRDGPP